VVKLLLKKIKNSEAGMGTVEVVIIVAALVAVALIFRKVMIHYVSDLLTTVFKADISNDGVNEVANKIISIIPTP
jgi:undecaprenyl pyrophosphate phosphatase UppP